MLLGACTPADFIPQQKEDAAIAPIDGVAAKSATPEPEVETYAPPFKPNSFCVPKYITHLGLKINLQEVCWNQVYVQYGQPNWNCIYQYTTQFTASQLQSALNALFHDRYQYSPREIETDNQLTSGGYAIITTFVKDAYGQNKTQGISGDCEKTDAEYDINLD